MASVVVGWKVCPRQFVFPQQCLLRSKRTVRGVSLWNIKCQMSNIKLTSRTCLTPSLQLEPAVATGRESAEEVLASPSGNDMM